MNMPRGIDIMQNTYCLLLNRCIYVLYQSPRAVFMPTCEVYIKIGFTKLMPDKCVFVKLENNIVGGPAMLSTDDITETIRHRFSPSYMYVLFVLPFLSEGPKNRV